MGVMMVAIDEVVIMVMLQTLIGAHEGSYRISASGRWMKVEDQHTYTVAQSNCPVLCYFHWKVAVTSPSFVIMRFAFSK
jgi:hypothetical protein